MGQTYEKTNEQWYQSVWCHGNGGQSEILLENNRRVDCLTDSHAIEMEFASKWHHAIGQALDYAMLTHKKAGIVLILRRPNDHYYWQQLNETINYYQLPIMLWQLGP
ncbi:hypothetical protein CI610_00430 [invertebrate metagenome]|uniref:Uncharacterized protein n=1 Tax=invertebrate metagenome TaxID=1711999 RepID=A0A2H9TBN5_9ZZZZ